MKTTGALLCLTILAACDSEEGDLFEPPEPPAPRCDPTAPFGEAKPVGSLNGPTYDYDARLSLDERTVYFARGSWAAGSDVALFAATRTSTDVDFDEPVWLSTLSSDEVDDSPSVSRDGRTLFFERGGHIWRASRETTSVPFTRPTRVPVSRFPGEPYHQVSPSVSANELVYREVPASSIGDTFVVRASMGSDGSFGPVQSIRDVTDWEQSSTPIESDDGLRLYWSRPHERIVYKSVRESPTAAWPRPVALFELVGDPSWISPDDCTLYLTRGTTAGPYDIWVARRPM